MSEASEAKVIQLQQRRGGAAAGFRTRLCAGRYEIVTVGPNAEFGFIGSDPYGTSAYTGLVVPAAPSASIGDARYLLMLARASFGSGEKGVRLVGIRLYAELVARILPGEQGGPTTTFRREIRSPLWHPPDGDLSFHVMVLPRTLRDTRHPANTDGFVFQDSQSPAILFQVPAPYAPPNGGRPWGTPLAASLGNIHELRYKWRDEDGEYVLDVPVPAACDVALFASVRQNDPSTNPGDSGLSANQFAALSDEDKFLTAFHGVAQYGVVAGALTFDQNLGEDAP